MSFKEDLEKPVKDAKPGDTISVAIVGTEADKQEYENAGFDLVAMGKIVECNDSNQEERS